MVTTAMKWTRPRDAHADFEQLFAAEYRRVVAIARRVLGNDAEAEDVAQDVFCAFYRSHPADAPFAGAWLHRAAAHAALNVVRGARRRRLRETRDAERSLPAQTGTQTEDNPEQAALAAEARREVRTALARIPDRQAEVLVLRCSGLSYVEIAEALDVKVGQIGTLLRRAEERLAKEMTRESHR